MRVYCDTSVLAELLLDPPSSRATRAALDSWSEQGVVTTSQLTTVELGRLVMRADSRTTAAKLNIADLPVQYIALGDVVLRNAASLPVRFLKSPDAIHVASALTIQADIVLTNDRQMKRACEELGLAVASSPPNKTLRNRRT